MELDIQSLAVLTDQGLGGIPATGDQSIIVDRGGRNGKPDLPGEKLLLASHRQPLCWRRGSWDLVYGGVCSRIYMASFIQLQSLPVCLSDPISNLCVL